MYEKISTIAVFSPITVQNTLDIFVRLCGFFLCFSSGSESKINAGGWKEKKQPKKKDSITSHGSPCTQQKFSGALTSGADSRSFFRAKCASIDLIMWYRDPIKPACQTSASSRSQRPVICESAASWPRSIRCTARLPALILHQLNMDRCGCWKRNMKRSLQGVLCFPLRCFCIFRAIQLYVVALWAIDKCPL